MGDARTRPGTTRHANPPKFDATAFRRFSGGFDRFYAINQSITSRRQSTECRQQTKWRGSCRRFRAGRRPSAAPRSNPAETCAQRRACQPVREVRQMSVPRVRGAATVQGLLTSPPSLLPPPSPRFQLFQPALPEHLCAATGEARWRRCGCTAHMQKNWMRRSTRKMQSMTRSMTKSGSVPWVGASRNATS